MTPHCCPVCAGSGLVSRPPWIAGDQFAWSDTSTSPYPCKACRGTGIVWSSIGNTAINLDTLDAPTPVPVDGPYATQLRWIKAAKKKEEQE